MNTVILLPGERLTVSNLGREGAVSAKITQAAANIIDTVRAEGDAALRRYAAEFDGVDLTDFRVPQERIDAALEQVDASLIAALEKAAAQSATSTSARSASHGSPRARTARCSACR